MIAAHIKGGEMLIFFRRLSLRVFDCIKKSARRLPSLRNPDLAAQDAEPAFGVGPRLAADNGNKPAWSGDTSLAQRRR
jgi:hypothetical protein